MKKFTNTKLVLIIFIIYSQMNLMHAIAPLFAIIAYMYGSVL